MLRVSSGGSRGVVRQQTGVYCHDGSNSLGLNIDVFLVLVTKLKNGPRANRVEVLLTVRLGVLGPQGSQFTTVHDGKVGSLLSRTPFGLTEEPLVVGGGE